MHHRGVRSPLLTFSLLLAPVVQLSCSTSKPPPLDVPLPAGQARAGKVTKTSELIGGPEAFARVGDSWKLYNSKVRFLVQDVGTAFGLDIYGGNLIDADLVRAGDDGTNGNDLFRETFPIIGLHELSATSIEVISDGTHGGAAQLRVHGTDAPSMILPQLDDIAQDLGGTITLDYILEPDVPYLKIVTTYHAPNQAIDTLGLGDFMSFGASLTVISPENGFTGKDSTISFMGSVGDGTSYGYVYPDGPLTLPIVDASGTATLLSSDTVAPNGTAQVTRYLVVGDGSASSVIGPMYALRNLATGHVSGVVRDASGAPVAAARLTLFASPYAATSNAIDQARSGMDGSYAFDDPPGDYVVIVGGIGRLRGAPTPVTIAASPQSLDVQVGAAGQATLDIGEMVNGVRMNAPAKVSFLATNVEAPDPRFGPDPTENERNGVWAVALSPDGHGTVALKPGTYNVVVSRGVEYESATLANVMVAPGGAPTSVRADLVRVVDTTGWISGDYHQHSQGSIDSPVPILQRVAEDLAEGVELPAGTDHDNITDFRPYIAQLHGEAWMSAVPGDEVSVNGIGHFNAYPLTIDAAAPYAKIGTQLWARDTVDAFVTKLRALEPKPIVVHVSHPRTFSLAGYFNTVHYDPTSGASMASLDGFDAMEVNGDLGQPSDFLAANDATIHKAAQAAHPSGITQLRDWFSLLDQGKTTCALGNSDTHQRNGGTGYPRNFLGLGLDDPRQATGDALVQAIKAQRVTISNGPFLTVQVNGQDAMGKAAALNLKNAPTATLNVKVQAPSWVGVSSIEVYGNGRPLSLSKTAAGTFAQTADGAAGSTLQAPIDAGDAKAGAVRLDGTVTVTPAKDTWYVVIVRGSGSMAPIAGGAPYAYHNPVYVDVAGDGWTAPGLP
jgi:hypothetical protein